MKKPFFEPDDFDIDLHDASVHDICKQANAKLNSLIESWPTVYDGNSGLFSRSNETWSLVKYDDKNYTTISSNFTNSRRQAKLAFIEELPKKECDHKPIELQDDVGSFAINPVCRYCNAELKATWSKK